MISSAHVLQAEGLFSAGLAAEEANDTLQAVAFYTSAIEADPGYAFAYLNLGSLHFRCKHFHAAEETYRKAIATDPTYAMAFYDLGCVLDELKRPEDAIKAYRQAIALDSTCIDAHYNLALSYQDAGEFRLAIRHFQAYIRHDKTSDYAKRARNSIHQMLAKCEHLSVVWRSDRFISPQIGKAALVLL